MSVKLVKIKPTLHRYPGDLIYVMNITKEGQTGIEGLLLCANLPSEMNYLRRLARNGKPATHPRPMDMFIPFRDIAEIEDML